MKNSLFKRAIATAATVPLALTQCLTYSFAAQEEAENDSAVIATADAASATSFTLDSLLYIAPDKTESEWNLKIDGALTQLIAKGKTTGKINTGAFVDTVVKSAGEFSGIANAVLSQIKSASYEIQENKDIVITVEMGEVADALEEDFNHSLGVLNEKLAEKYGVPAFANIDYSSVKTGGKFIAVIGTSALGLDTTVTAKVKYIDNDGNEYTTTDEILAFAQDKIDGFKAIANAEIDKYADYIDVTAAKQDVLDNIGQYDNFVRFASNKINLFLNYSNSASSVAELIADVDGFASRYTAKDLPESASAAASLKTVASFFTSAKNGFNNAAAPYSLDIEAAEAGAFIDSLANVTASAENGDLYFYGEFEDAEADQVAAWYAENSEDKEYVSSYKFIEIKADGTDIKNATASADLQIKRVVTTKDKTTTTSTTSDTTTTTSDTTTTTSDTTTTTSDTTTTTSDTTTTTSDTTTTTSDTTTTTSDTTTTTSDTTTTSTDTTTTTTNLVVADVYVEYEADYGFYTEQDEAFSADQVSSFTLYATYDQYGETAEGMKVKVGTTDPVAIDGASFTFAATPAETYSTETFKHDIALVAAADITDKDGNVLVKAGDGFKTNGGADAIVEVYVGLKGDTNLDNKITAVDASYVLVYYAELSAGNVDSNKVRLALENELTEDPAGIYDNFAAFLADIKNDIAAEDAWAVGKASRKDAEIQRSVIATDASAILVFASIIADGETTSADAWAQVIGE